MTIGLKLRIPMKKDKGGGEGTRVDRLMGMLGTICASLFFCLMHGIGSSFVAGKKILGQKF